LFLSLGSFSRLMGNVGTQLGKAVEQYNKAVNALEAKVLPDAERLGSFGAAGSEDAITPPVSVAALPRHASESANESSPKEDKISAA